MLKLKLTAFNDDWLRMVRLQEEMEKLDPRDPRYAEIQSILDLMDDTLLEEVEID
jgi:hypothetical protein